jgi:hypothetical protein
VVETAIQLNFACDEFVRLFLVKRAKLDHLVADDNILAVAGLLVRRKIFPKQQNGQSVLVRIQTSSNRPFAMDVRYTHSHRKSREFG